MSNHGLRDVITNSYALHHDTSHSLDFTMLATLSLEIDVSSGTVFVFTTFALYRIGLATRI
jgi:hypothetical protein